MSMSSKQNRESSHFGWFLLTGAALAAGYAFHRQNETEVSPAAPPVPDNFPIRRGDRGEHVRQMQQALRRRGGMVQLFIDRSGGADGIYGPGTEKALVQAMFPTVITEQTYQKIVAGSQEPASAGQQDNIAVTRANAPIFRSIERNWMGMYEGDGRITTLPAKTAAGRLMGSKVGHFILLETNINQRRYRFWIGEHQVEVMPESTYQGQFRTGKIMKKTAAVVAAIVAFFK
jgi:peptidoglycan hydrolase-like protein with peptidoglycan-binding domain